MADSSMSAVLDALKGMEARITDKMQQIEGRISILERSMQQSTRGEVHRSDAEPQASANNAALPAPNSKQQEKLEEKPDLLPPQPAIEGIASKDTPTVAPPNEPVVRQKALITQDPRAEQRGLPAAHLNLANYKETTNATEHDGHVSQISVKIPQEEVAMRKGPPNTEAGPSRIRSFLKKVTPAPSPFTSIDHHSHRKDGLGVPPPKSPSNLFDEDIIQHADRKERILPPSGSPSPKRAAEVEAQPKPLPKRRRLLLEPYVLLDHPDPNMIAQHVSLQELQRVSHEDDTRNDAQESGYETEFGSDLTELTDTDEESEAETDPAGVVAAPNKAPSNASIVAPVPPSPVHEKDTKSTAASTSSSGNSPLPGSSSSRPKEANASKTGVISKAPALPPSVRERQSALSAAFTSSSSSVNDPHRPAASTSSTSHINKVVRSDLQRHSPAEQSRPRNPASPRVKVDVGRHTIGPNAVTARLGGALRFEVGIEPAARDVTVSRAFMSDEYGGNARSLYPKINYKEKRHSHHFLFPNLLQNPHAPKRPGEPGLLCRALDYIEWDGLTVKLLVRQAESKYLYLGDYSSTRVALLSREEFRDMSSASKKAWVTDVKSKAKYRELRARVILRRSLEREPTKGEVIASTASDNLTKAKLRTEDFVEAFEQGHESLHIWRLECVGYDEDFQRRLALKYPPYVLAHPKKASTS